MSYLRFGTRDLLWAMMAILTTTAFAGDHETFMREMRAKDGKPVRVEGAVSVGKLGPCVKLKSGNRVWINFSDPKDGKRSFDWMQDNLGQKVAVRGVLKREEEWNPPPNNKGVVAGHPEYFWIDFSDPKTTIIRIREF